MGVRENLKNILNLDSSTVYFLYIASVVISRLCTKIIANVFKFLAVGSHSHRGKREYQNHLSLDVYL